MKVCFFSHTAGRAGAERSLIETLRSLRREAVECVVVVPRPGPLVAELDRLGIEHAFLPYRWWRGPAGGPVAKRVARTLWNLALVVPAARFIRRQGCDLAYTNTIAVPVGAIAAAIAGVGHVWHLRELARDLNRFTFDVGDDLALRIIDRFSVLCLANSHFVADRYRKAIDPRKLHVVYQGVSLGRSESRQSVPPPTDFRCVVVGSLGHRKRQAEAIAAVASLVRQGIGVELLIVGEGDREYERELRRAADESALDGRVSFVGAVDCATPFLESADAVVVCSWEEPFGRVTVEAMLAGKPVVGAASGGTAELIEDEFNGFLYESGRPDRLADRLRLLIEQPDLARGVGERARAWARARFSERRYGQEVLAHLRRAAGGASAE